MINRNLVSIIIPCFNAVKYTRQCLNSVLKHSTCDYEIILINNGSSDKTREFLKEFKKKNKHHCFLKKISVFNMPYNIGVAKALNLGIRKSSGQYVCYINSDVIVTKNWLVSLTKACEKNRKNAVVGTLFNSFEDNKFINAVEKNKQEIDRVAKTIYLLNKNKVKKAKTIHGLCMLIKKSIFSKVGFFNEKFYPCFGEDIEFCQRVKKCGYNLVDALDVFIFHYWNKSSVSKEFRSIFGDIKRLRQKHYKKFKISEKYKI
mgnify:CR=1 FL=1